MKLRIKRNFVASFVFSVIAIASLNAQTPTVQTFPFTGGIQTFTVPPCVTNITVVARGAQGTAGTSTAGLGGIARGIMAVSPGQVLNIYVGGQAGFNGGGTGVSPGGNGGGGSDVRFAPYALADRQIVAGGGGGGGATNGNAPGGGGGGGTAVGTNFVGGGGGKGANNQNPPVGGQPGATNGGAGGVGNGSNNGGAGGGGGLLSGGGGGTNTGHATGQAGTLGQGGNGGGATGPGGGGGGYYGGGGASGGVNSNAGGGGGSSWTGTLTSPSFTSSIHTGNGSITFSYSTLGTGVSAASSPTTICLNNTATLNASGVNTYTWSTGSNSPSISVSPSVNTNYTVMGTNSFGCASTVVITVTVDPALPSLTVANTASATGGVCPGTSVTLTGSGATSHSWSGGPVNGQPYAVTGTNTFVLSGTNACGTSTAATSVSVHPPPTVSGVASQPSICTPNGVNITGVGNAVSYTLSNGLGSGVNFFPSSTANYTLTGTSALGCTNSAVVGVTVVTTPIAPPLASPPLICIGNFATLNSSGATNYTWTTPTGTVGTQSFTVNPTSSTIYTLTKSNANCVNIQTLQLFVNNLPPVFAISSPTLVCAGKPSTLTGAGALTYTWTSPTNFTFTGGNPIVTPTINSIYTVTASDGTCVNTTTVEVATNPNPTINIVPTSTSICFGQNVSLSGNGALSYVWAAPNMTSNTTGVTIAESPTASTLYQLTGQNAFNCTTTISQVVIVRTTPTLNVQTTKPLVCSGGASGLTVTAIGGGPYTYTWDANAGGGNTSIVTVNPINTTQYTVNGTNSQTCSASQVITVVVFSPTFAVNSPTSSCLGGTITLTGSGANTYTWNGNVFFPSIQVSPPSPTVYFVSATSSSLGVNCVSSNSVVVTIYQNPTVTAVATRTQVCRNETTEVTANGAVSYQWSTNPPLTGSTVPVSPNNNTTYTVVGTDQNGCIGTTTVLVRTSTCVGLNKLAGDLGLSVYPNPSSGIITLKANQDLDLELFNEIGQKIKEIHLSASNNRTINVEDLSPGIYFIRSADASVNEKVIIIK